MYSWLGAKEKQVISKISTGGKQCQNPVIFIFRFA